MPRRPINLCPLLTPQQCGSRAQLLSLFNQLLELFWPQSQARVDRVATITRIDRGRAHRGNQS